MPCLYPKKGLGHPVVKNTAWKLRYCLHLALFMEFSFTYRLISRMATSFQMFIDTLLHFWRFQFWKVNSSRKICERFLLSSHGVGQGPWRRWRCSVAVHLWSAAIYKQSLFRLLSQSSNCLCFWPLAKEQPSDYVLG